LPEDRQEPLKEPLGNDEAKKLIGEIARTGTVTFVPHAIKAMADDNLTAVDCTNVLRGGWVEFSEPHGAEWRYRIRTARIVVIVAFESRGELRVVTVWRMREGR
jgi:hypothetical protein